MRCNPTRTLRDEHAIILDVVHVLERIVEQGPDRASVDDIRDCIAFFRLYVDACHHGKEESLLFEELVRAGFPGDEGPIALMLEEHAQGRALVRQLDEAVARLSAGDPAAWHTFARDAHSYIELLRGHILKEDSAVFEMADDAIDEPACRRLCAEYDSACAGDFAGRSRAQLEELARQLRDRLA